MTVPTRISLCIPTFNRADCLQGALESGLREAASLPPGTVEVIVCDNASTDGTAEVIQQIKARHPELVALRNETNVGFDRNYLRCVDEAKGEYVWVMGDDDLWLPGSLQRVLQEIEAGADACLCLAEACDLDLNSITVLPWFLDEHPPTVWRLETEADLTRYFDSCARTAAAFAFISVAIFRRDRFLEVRDTLLQTNALNGGYPHVWAMARFLRRPTVLHYIPDVLIRNRLSDLHADSTANQNLFARWRMDLYTWAEIADDVFADMPAARRAFSEILGRNHHNTILPGMRRCAPSEEAWREVVPYLERAGFSRVRIAATEAGFRFFNGTRLPMPSLNPGSLCLADLPLVTRGARHVVVLALGGLPNLLGGAGLLAALRSGREPSTIHMVCGPESVELLDGFSIHAVDPNRYMADETYRDTITAPLEALKAELVVNLDPQRAIQADDLAAAIHPAGAIAFDLPERGHAPELVAALNEGYTVMLSATAGAEAMRQELGLEPAVPALWPLAASQAEAQAFFENTGWDPARTLALIADHPDIPGDPAFREALRAAADQGWNLIGIGGRATYAAIEECLAPLEDRAVNLAGGLRMATIAALLQRCATHAGGTPLLRALAAACGCAPFSA